MSAVSPSTSAMRFGESESSSATIWRIAARAPVPRSTLPAKTVTTAIRRHGEESIDAVSGNRRHQLRGRNARQAERDHKPGRALHKASGG